MTVLHNIHHYVFVFKMHKSFFFKSNVVFVLDPLIKYFDTELKCSGRRLSTNPSFSSKCNYNLNTYMKVYYRHYLYYTSDQSIQKHILRHISRSCDCRYCFLYNCLHTVDCNFHHTIRQYILFKIIKVTI